MSSRRSFDKVFHSLKTTSRFRGYVSHSQLLDSPILRGSTNVSCNFFCARNDNLSHPLDHSMEDEMTALKSLTFTTLADTRRQPDP